MNPFAEFGGIMEPFKTPTTTARGVHLQQTHQQQLLQTNFDFAAQSYTSTDSSIPPFLEFSAELPSIPPKYVYGLNEFNKAYDRPSISDKPSMFDKPFIHIKL
jgi:hypothetical protein